MPTHPQGNLVVPTPVQLGWRSGLYSLDLPVLLTAHDRRQHLALLGRSGVGKSTVLKNLFAHDVASGAGVALIDPHGDLARECIDLIPRHRIDQVLFLSPADLAFPVSFNLLENVPPDARPVLVSRLVSMFRHLFGDSWGVRVERLLMQALSALLDQGNATLLGLIRLLDDAVWRDQVVARVTDPLVRRYWLKEFPELDDRLGGELDQPLRNKLSFLTAPALRNILGQPTSTFHPRRFMDAGNILIADLSKGKLGDTHAQILGSLLVAGFEQAAMSRGDSAEATRKDFFLLIDEFQNFVSDSFPVLLAEARKYRLSVNVACQYLDQLTEQTRAALLGNVGSLLSFRIGAQDADVIGQDMHLANPLELTSLPVGTAYARLLDHGHAYDPFPVRLLAPPAGFAGVPGTSPIAQRVIKQSRRHYARPRAKVEAAINRFLALEEQELPRKRRVRR
jgi:hypothetical protein